MSVLRFCLVLVSLYFTGQDSNCCWLYLDFLALSHVLVLRDGVGDDDGLEAGAVDPETFEIKL